MEESGSVNVFANDGSFMEMFRKKMEEEKQQRTQVSANPEAKGQSANRVREKNLPSSPGKDVGVSRKETLQGHAPSAAPGDPAGDTSVQASSAETNDDAASKRKEAEDDQGKVSAAAQSSQVQSASDTSKTAAAPAVVPPQKKYSLLSHVGKRRDGKVSLKTGAVKKQRTSETQDTKDMDPWSKYMAEVQKYKAHVCGDEDKSRPLVK